MASLKEKLLQVQEARAAYQPRFFDLRDHTEQAQLEGLLDENPHTRIIDTYEGQLKEILVIQKPWLHLDKAKHDQEFPAFRDQHYGEHESWQAGKWVYLPWRHVLLHLLDDDLYQQVRTARNRNLIPADEQQQYYHSTVGIAGLSVGNSVALALVLMGGGKHLKLADPDSLELTNLNRIRGSIAELTNKKVHMAARQIYELDPYADLTVYPEGLTEENLDDFFDGLDVVVDEMDNLGLKIRLRQEAKKRRLPVLMATDNGDSGLLDVERYDLDENIAPFHGRAGEDIADQILGKQLPLPVIGQIIGEKLVGYDIVEPRMQQSLLEIGKTIPTWPQLGGAALLNGVAVAVAIRKILTDQPLVTKRAILSLSSWLVPGWESDEHRAARAAETKKFATAYTAAVNQFLGQQRT